MGWLRGLVTLPSIHRLHSHALPRLTTTSIYTPLPSSPQVASAQTINTGLTALLVNARLPHGVTYTLPGIVSQVGLFNGDFDDFNTAWYGTVGTTICMTVGSDCGDGPRSVGDCCTTMMGVCHVVPALPSGAHNHH